MKLFFLRHGDAANSADDAARVLSNEGKHEAVRIGAFLKAKGFRLHAAYSSPLIRAVQTAEIVSGTCNTNARAKVQLVAALANEASQAQFDAWLKKIEEVENVLLVGHMPSLAERAAHLLRMPDPNAFEFPKGGLALLETINRRDAVLRFFVSPKILG